MKKILCAALCAAALAAGGTFPACAAPVKLISAWLGEHETFAAWYAKKQGWDAEEGLDLQMLRFDSGYAAVEGLKAYKWAVAGCGAVPALMAPGSEDIDIVAVANDESMANAIYVRKGNPILTAKGSNVSLPDICGSAETVRGSTVLCPKGTSAHYLLLRWLQELGMTEKDVHIKNLDARQALGAFSGGLGDILPTWSPYTLEAERKGFVSAADSQNCGVTQPVLLVAERRYAEKNPQHIEAFLRMYFRAVDAIIAAGPEKMAEIYMTFTKEWAGITMDRDQAIWDLRTHTVFPVRQQLELFSSSSGESRLHAWLGRIVSFQKQFDLVKQKDEPRLDRLNSINGVYLKAISPSD
ncbi:MAG: ABC transporter substrate-binding protein [Mailhella sp.]|nr:ABC transporter substrate-binding protein [Mailhella sp.]